MKKIIITIALIISISKLYSQNIIDPPKLQSYTDTTVFDRTFSDNHYIKGWRWDSQKALSKALKMNQVDIYLAYDISQIQ